jgi:adenosylmethionine-8-amino-7-oxononanoate aminotransferase
VLQHLVQRAHGLGILVCADEILCGLGRHGLGTLFAASHPGLGIAHLVDAVTFGKALAGGCGDLLAGVALKAGAAKLHCSRRTALQSHTYAAASTRALLTAVEVLKELPSCLPYVQQGHVLAQRHLAIGLSPAPAALHGDGDGSRRRRSSGGGRRNSGEAEAEAKSAAPRDHTPDGVAAAVRVHGRGLLWGGQFAHFDASERARAVQLLGAHCSAQRVGVYLVPSSGGFMVTPPLDCADSAAGGADLAEGLQRVRRAVHATVAELNWPAAALAAAPYDGASDANRGVHAPALPPRASPVLRVGGRATWGEPWRSLVAKREAEAKAYEL